MGISHAMKTKTCFKCHHAKDLADFYRHPRMADGHLNKCKECAKADARANSKTAAARTRDRNRANDPARVAARQAYAKTVAGKAALAKGNAAWRARNPDKAAAHRAIGYAVTKGVVSPQPCQVCGDPGEAHHHDYSQPLAVTWLCPRHHAELHKQQRRAA